MQFIADYWLLWLIIFASSSGYAMYNQLRRMKSIVNTVLDTDSSLQTTATELKKNVSVGVKGLVVSAMIGWISGVLLFVAIAINIAQAIAK